VAKPLVKGLLATHAPRMSVNATFHQRLIEELRALILGGGFAPGAQFLTERDIAERFDTSRPTANKALSSLVSQGLLEVRRGAGTFVRESVLDYDLERLVSFTDKALAAGKKPGTALI
jgi:GntR family transcriptional regulator